MVMSWDTIKILKFQCLKFKNFYGNELGYPNSLPQKFLNFRHCSNYHNTSNLQVFMHTALSTEKKSPVSIDYRATLYPLIYI